MVGTIHALPDDTEWRTPAITQATDAADLLIVEIAALDDGERVAGTFSELSTTPGLPPLEQRLPGDLVAPLTDLLERGGIERTRFAAVETWAAAIMLAQVDATGDAANGVDRALINDFADRPVRELEGAAAQLSIFDRLTEAQQRSMLAAVVRGARPRARTPPGFSARGWQVMLRRSNNPPARAFWPIRLARRPAHGAQSALGRCAQPAAARGLPPLDRRRHRAPCRAGRVGCSA